MTSLRTVTLRGGGTSLVVACSAEPYQLGVGAQLWGTAPYAYTSRRVANIPGERVDNIQALPRTFALPLIVEGATELEIDQRLGALGTILAPDSELQVIFERPDGTTRAISAFCIGGREAVSATSEAGHLQRVVPVPLVMRAYWPYWRSVADQVDTVGPATFNDGRGAGSNQVTVTNGGDVACYPEITVTGYAENVEAVNLTTGKVWRVLEILEVGDVLRIDTDPRTPGVWLNDVLAYNIGGRHVVDPISEVTGWHLVPGANHLLFRGNTSTGAEAIGGFTLRWREQFETC